jgi:hypothetical protein
LKVPALYVLSLKLTTISFFSYVNYRGMFGWIPLLIFPYTR